MKSICVGSLLASILCLFATNAQANSYQSTTYTTYAGGGNPVYLVPAFNTSLGTLTGFSFEITGSLIDSVSVNNPGNTPPLIGFFTNEIDIVGAVNSSTPQGRFFFANQSFSTNSNTLSESISIDIISSLSSSYLSSIPSGSPIDLDLTLGPFPHLNSPNALGAFSANPQLNFVGITSNYIYTPVPEPAALAIFAFSLISLGLVKYRRSSPGQNSCNAPS